MKVILEFLYAQTSNFGLSIIILSISINILILPFHYLAEELNRLHKIQLKPLQPKIDLIKKEYKGQERHFYLQTLFKINDYHPTRSLRASFGLLLQVPFFFAAFHFLGNYELFNNNSFGLINNLGEQDQLFFGINFLPLLMTIISLQSIYISRLTMTSKERFQVVAISMFFLIFLYFESSALLIYWTANNFFSLSRSWLENKFNRNIVKQKLVYYLKIFIKNNLIQFIFRDSFCQSIILFFGLLFIYKGIPIAASDTGMYDSDYKWVALTLILSFLISVFFVTIIYQLFNNKWKELALKIITFIGLSGLFFSFLFPIEIGEIKALAIPPFYIEETFFSKIFKLLLLVPFFILFLFLFNKIRRILWVTVLLSNIFLTAITVSAGLNPKSLDTLTYKDSNILLNNEANDLYSFSRDSNTIVIMLDMFQGNMFADIVEKHPEIKQQFSGFIYYPNTLSHGSSTWKSIGALVGGEEFQVQFMKKIQESSLINKPTHFDRTALEKAFLTNMAIAEKYNHSFSIFKPSYVDCDLFNSYKYSICSKNVYIDDDLMTEKNEIYRPDSVFHTAKFFTQLSLVLNLPHQTKNIVGRKISGNYFSEYMNNVNQYAQLKNLTEFANLNSKNKTFKIFENKITHTLWMLDNECKVVNENFDNYEGLFNSGYCSLKLLDDFFTKLKSLGIYDKTKIIIVSDHGTTIENGNNFISTNNFNVSPSASSALMLVKDFNQNADLMTSMQFLSNIDTYGFSLSGVSENKEIQKDVIKNPRANRSLIYIHKVSPSNSYNITEAYEVKNDMFDKKNWNILSKNQILQLGQ